MNRQIKFRGLKDLPKTACDEKGHKPICLKSEVNGTIIYGCSRCVNIIWNFEGHDLKKVKYQKLLNPYV